MMRRLTLLALLLPLLTQAAPAQAADLSGAWVGKVCPAGKQDEVGACSNFVLELHQQDDRLCGAHFFANADASEIDEGAAPSLFGDIRDDVASVIVTSTRGKAPVQVNAQITRQDGALRWKWLEKPKGDTLLPSSARLTRSPSKTLFAPLFAQELSAACSSAFAMAAQREAAARAVLGEPPAAPPSSDAPSGQQ